MSTQIKYRGGTAAEHASFTGAEREITVDTTTGTIRVHDGVTVGGIPLARADLVNASGQISSSVASGAATPGTCSVSGTLFYNTTESKLYICDGANYQPNLSDPAPSSGAATPGSCSLAGEMFYNTTDQNLYVCNGSTYERAVPDVAASTGASTPGSCSIVGELFFNETDQRLYVCNGSTYEAATADGAAAVGTSTPGSCSVDGTFFFNSTEEKLYVCENGSYTLAVPTSAQIEEGSLTVSAFAASIRPVELFASLPTTGNTAGRLVFLTTDNKLYRYNGSAFVSTIPTSDLTGTISAGQIAANAITANEIAAGAITTGKIAAGAISATEIASSAITTDKLAASAITSSKIATDAITSNKIVANAVIAGKIGAAAVDAAAISTNAVTADKISSGAITTAKIAAGAITTTTLAASAVTASNIASGAVTAAKIAAGAVTVDKIGSSSAAILTGRTFGLGTGANAFGYSGTVVASTTASSCSGVLSVGGSTSFADPAILGAVCNTGVNSCGGIFGNATSTAYSTWRTYAYVGGPQIAGTFRNETNNKTASVCNSGFAFYADVGAYGPFTGVHDGLALKTETIAEGDIVCDTGFAINKTIIDTITKVTKSTSANQKAALGVFIETLPDHKPTTLCEQITQSNGLVVSEIKAEYTPLLSDNNVVSVASLGEGLINVCGENGTIEIGDLIVTSSIPGKGMKQSDDIVRNITVAKARETVTFSSPTEVKQIACIYMCG